MKTFKIGDRVRIASTYDDLDGQEGKIASDPEYLNGMAMVFINLDTPWRQTMKSILIFVSNLDKID